MFNHTTFGVLTTILVRVIDFKLSGPYIYIILKYGGANRIILKFMGMT